MFVFDAHCDILQAVSDHRLDLGRRQRTTHFDLPRARAGGVGAQVFVLFSDPEEFLGEPAWARTLALLEAFEALLARHPRRVVPARREADLAAAQSRGALAAYLGLEGAHGLGRTERALPRLRLLARRGLRYLGLTWNNSNAFAGAAADRGGGLTTLGVRLASACQELGVQLDVSHASDATVRDVLSLGRPVLASHSNARALCDVPRNLPDPLLRAVGRGGGVVCANFFPGFLSPGLGGELARRQQSFAPTLAALTRRIPDDRPRRLRALRRAILRSLRTVPRVPLARVVEHVLHLVRVAGPHAVGLGADFDGMLLTPRGLESAADCPDLERALRRQLPADVVRAVMGGNLRRLLA